RGRLRVPARTAWSSGPPMETDRSRPATGAGWSRPEPPAGTPWPSPSDRDLRGPPLPSQGRPGQLPHPRVERDLRPEPEDPGGTLGGREHMSHVTRPDPAGDLGSDPAAVERLRQ